MRGNWSSICARKAKRFLRKVATPARNRSAPRAFVLQGKGAGAARDLNKGKNVMFGNCLRISMLAIACSAIAVPASAASKYDGDWSVVITTNNGACASSVRYGIQIQNGRVIAGDGGAATVDGQVTKVGTVMVNVQAGGQRAEGSGRSAQSAAAEFGRARVRRVPATAPGSPSALCRALSRTRRSTTTRRKRWRRTARVSVCKPRHLRRASTPIMPRPEPIWV